MARHSPHQNELKIGPFERYLRTGRILAHDVSSAIEQKFNPYHDPRNGQFTFAPGVGHSASRAGLASHRAADAGRASEAVRQRTNWAEGRLSDEAPITTAKLASLRNSSGDTRLQPRTVQYRPNPRARMGNNGGPPLNDPLTLEQVFPGLSSSPGGSILGLADNILDFTGPSQQLTNSLNTEHIRMLLRQIRSIDPKYRYDFLEQTRTLEGQLNAIRQIRAERAAVLFRIKSDPRLLQVETLRLMQEKADLSYEEAVHLFETGKLEPRLSRNEAIGNHVDRYVRRELREFYSNLGIDFSRQETVRVIGREYDSSGSDLTYRIPDARVGEIAFDVTLTRKTLSMPQIRGFMNADFRPEAVVVIRPRQLGSNSTYAIRRKDKQR